MKRISLNQVYKLYVFPYELTRVVGVQARKSMASKKRGKGDDDIPLHLLAYMLPDDESFLPRPRSYLT